MKTDPRSPIRQWITMAAVVIVASYLALVLGAKLVGVI